MFPDISEFQGTVDWSALGGAFQSGQIEAVAMRAGFGTVRADGQFGRNQSECRARGIPAIYYWFNYPDTNSPDAEAAMFNATVGPLQANEAMCGDFEDDGAHLFPRGQAGVDWARRFLTLLEAPHTATWWYTYPFLLSVIPFDQLYGVWPFWIADYGTAPDSAFNQAIARQFTNCGATPGVSGCSDQSRVLMEPLSQWLTRGGPTPMTDQEVTALFTDWYVVYAGRYPNANDMAYIQAHWLPAWRANPVQARFDFGVAASSEAQGKDVRPVRHFEMDQAIATIPVGPPGPPGPATYVKHTHNATTDTGTRV